MKKQLASKKRKKRSDDLSREYQFDRMKLKPNRFAVRMPAEMIAVVLEPDVAAVFKSSKTVNELLRSVISAVPQPKTKRRTR